MLLSEWARASLPVSGPVVDFGGGLPVLPSFEEDPVCRCPPAEGAPRSCERAELRAFLLGLVIWPLADAIRCFRLAWQRFVLRTENWLRSGPLP